MSAITKMIPNVAFTAACVVVTVLGVFRIQEQWSSRNRQVPSSPTVVENISLPVGDALTLGSPRARTVVVEFSDFQCPFCARFATDTFKTIKTEFIDAGIVSYIFMHRPLEFHQFAQKASEAVECAAAQGRVWDMRARLFSQQTTLDERSLYTHAAALGLDQAEFQQCLAGAMTDRVLGQVQIAKAASVKNTPTFLIGHWGGERVVRVTRRILGAQPIDVFRATIRDVSLN